MSKESPFLQPIIGDRFAYRRSDARLMASVMGISSALVEKFTNAYPDLPTTVFHIAETGMAGAAIGFGLGVGLRIREKVCLYNREHEEPLLCLPFVNKNNKIK